MLGYTIWGGMWSVAMTDLFQSVMIIVGVVLIAWLVGDMAGGPAKVIAAAAEAGKFEFWPKGGTKEWLAFAAAWMTLAIGSIPQQDVFQRVTSAKNEKTAVRGTLLGGVIYFSFAFVPIYIVYAGLLIDPSLGKLLTSGGCPRDAAASCPTSSSGKTPLWAQVLFFGALLSAILSTASGAMIAPTSLFTENIIRPLYPRMSDRQFLLTLRVVLVCVHARGAAVRAQFEEHHVRNGAERVQGDAGGRLRAARRRHFLEARQQRGRRAVRGVRPGCLAGGGHAGARRDRAAAPGRPRGIHIRHGDRLAGARQRPGAGVHADIHAAQP